MNCVKGDIARVVNVEDVDADKFVTCIEYAGQPNDGKVESVHKDCWRVDRLLTWRGRGGQPVLWPFCPDSFLRPIRDTGAPDEMLELVGKPETATL